MTLGAWFERKPLGIRRTAALTLGAERESLTRGNGDFADPPCDSFLKEGEARVDAGSANGG